MVIIELKHYFSGMVQTELYLAPYSNGDVTAFNTFAEARDELLYKGYSRLIMGEYDPIETGDKANVYRYVDDMDKPVTFDPTLGVLKETIATIRKLKVGRG